MEVLIQKSIKTEIGVISSDWKVLTLEGLCKPNGLVRGPFGGALKKEIFTHQGYKVYEQQNAIYRNVSDGQYYISDKKYDELKRFSIKPGDFIVSCSGTIGRIFLLPNNSPQGIINQALLKISIDDRIINSQYFLHYFEWERFQASIIDSTQGGAMKNLVGMSIFRKTKFAIPSIPEQTAIATALSDTDALIENLEKLIAKKRSIKQGVKQELLKPKSNWIEKRLGEVCEIFGRIGFRGYTVNDIVDENNGAISLSPSNIVDGELYFEKSTYISWAKYEESPEIKLNIGDIVLVKTASVGKTALVKYLPKETTLNPQIVVIKNIKINNEFLAYLIGFKYIQRQIYEKVVGGVVPTLSQEQILNFKIALPSQDLQNEIAETLSSLDTEIYLLRKQLTKYQNIKQGMMQSLLTGKIRFI